MTESVECHGGVAILTTISRPNAATGCLFLRRSSFHLWPLNLTLNTDRTLNLALDPPTPTLTFYTGRPQELVPWLARKVPGGEIGPPPTERAEGL